MSKVTLTDAERDAVRTHVETCVHEAGHAIWAVLSGAQVHEITASADDGRVMFSGHGEHGAEIAYAGMYAEALFAYGGIPPVAHMRDAWRYASPEDREHFGETIAPPRHIESSIEYVMPRVKALARRLAKHGSATHADVEAVLGITRDVPAAVVASAVRSRAGWPVSGGAR